MWSEYTMAKQASMGRSAALTRQGALFQTNPMPMYMLR
jgi:hypothetical protein